MPGYPRTQAAQGIHDDPEAIMLLIKSNGTEILFVSVDVVIVTKDRADRLRELISRKNKIPKNQIFVEATHTHSGPSGFDTMIKIPDDNENSQFFNWSIKKIQESVNQLRENMQQVSAEICETTSQGFYSNRIDARKKYNNKIWILNFVNSEDETIAGMLNINVHSTVVGPENTWISKDLIGSIRETCYQELGVLYYAFPGACGDVSNRHNRQGNDFAELSRVVKGITNQIIDAKEFKKITMDYQQIEAFSYVIDYDNQTNFPAYHESLTRIESILNAPETLSFDEIKLKKSEKSALESKLMTKHVHMDVKMVKIDFGEIVLITFPGELSSKLGEIVADSYAPEIALILGYTNDFHMYFMEKELYGKTYETIASLVPEGEPEKIVERMSKI
ncbi:neutral/alkaline non-lysosomal ceramidase N-terminal domain-containing protein [Enterococcus sp. HY326]|uniref:neutral/alkaline non-lysosomal ceramidase N-terminal domain-containing protein n=1 Tax=Enterococcus sp. HY326 TaxID=2971265 RepID=UPI00223FA6A5|nr:neutral/alkaline non-lysosomal ceramidase N-terminal domain-containing protein [Enterococcus sp. HY326]